MENKKNYNFVSMKKTYLIKRRGAKERKGDEEETMSVEEEAAVLHHEWKELQRCQEELKIKQRAIDTFYNATKERQMNVTVEKFYDEHQMNPNEFLAKLDKYFKFKQVNEEHKSIIFKSFLEGRAKLWADTVSSESQTYSDLQSKFLTEFYSIPIQAKLKYQWMVRQYEQHEGSLQNYFHRQIQAAKYLEIRMTSYEINYFIAQQFPIHIRLALSKVDNGDEYAMMRALAQFEPLQKESEIEKRG